MKMKDALGAALRFVRQPLLYSALVARQPYIWLQQRQRYRALPGNPDHVIAMLVPGRDAIGGGILSIYAFYCATSKVLGEQARVVLATYPNKLTSVRYRWFRNDAPLIGFNRVLDSLEDRQTVCLHLPEYYAALFLQDLTAAQQRRLRGLSKLHINVMNQNIQLMPPPAVINRLRQLTPTVTITTAHSSYTTPALRQLYAAPTHLLTAWFEQQEVCRLPYAEKENVMIVSPDEHPAKAAILAAIAQAFPALQLVIIRNMKYDDYKLLEAKAKWSISFGEGFDGYTVFPVLKGGVTFAVYNEDFFLPKYQAIPTFYPSYEVLARSIVADMRRLDHAAAYEAYNNVQYALCHEDYSYEKYLSRVRAFYQGTYSLP